MVLLPSLFGTSRAAAQVPLAPAPGDPAPLSRDLLARAASPKAADRQSALFELLALNSARAQNLIMVLLQRDYDPLVRAAAARALAATRNPDYAELLKYASLADPDPGVRSAAAEAYEALWPYGKRIKLAAGLSVLCPGCGYFYLRQPRRALAYLFPTAALLGTAIALAANSPTATGIDGKPVRVKDNDDPLILPLGAAAQNLWFYGIFATYRDARLAHGDAGYKYPIAREELPELAAAPFNPHVLKSPWVWAGVPGLLAAAYGFVRLVTPGDLKSGMRSLSDGGGVNFLGRHYGTKTGFLLGEAYFGSIFVTVGVGEESLFRGVIQAGLSETSLGLWGGWLAGSMIFGGLHVINFLNGDTKFGTAALAVPYLMATGSYLGYVYIRTNFSLATGTAIHFWYDFLLSTAAFIIDPDHQEFVVQHAFRF